MFRNKKKSKKVMFTESVMVAIERFRQAVEVMTSSPVTIISADVDARNIEMCMIHENLNGNRRDVEVSLTLGISGPIGCGCKCLELQGLIRLIQWPDNRWRVLYDSMFTFSLLERMFSAGEDVRWSRYYTACWTRGEKSLFPHVMVCERTGEGYKGQRMSFPSDRDLSDAYGDLKALPTHTRAGYTHADAHDMAGWFKGEGGTK